MLEELAEVDELIEALLRASEKIEKRVEKEGKTRIEDIDLTISVEVDGIEKRVELDLGVSGSKLAIDYEELVEEALEEGLNELDRLLQRGKANREAEGKEVRSSGP